MAQHENFVVHLTDDQQRLFREKTGVAPKELHIAVGAPNAPPTEPLLPESATVLLSVIGKAADW